MANPFGGDVDEALREAERLVGRLDESAQRVSAAATEAQRAGRTLRIPTAREPVATAPVPAQTREYAGLNRAVEQHERLLRRVRDLKAEISRLPSGSQATPEETLTRGRLERELRAAQATGRQTGAQVTAQRDLVAQGFDQGDSESRVRRAKEIHGQIRQEIRATLAEEERQARKGAEAVRQAEQAKTQAVQLSERERSVVRSAAAQGAVHFDEGLVPEQVARARELERRGLLEESYRTRDRHGLNRIGFRATAEGIRTVDDDGAIRRSRAESAERDLEDARGRLRRARNPQRVQDLQTLVSTYERDLALLQEFEQRKTRVVEQAERARRYTYEVTRGPGGARQFQVIRRDEQAEGRGLPVSYHRDRDKAEAVAAKRARDDETAEIARSQRVSQADAERLYKEGTRGFADAESEKTRVAQKGASDRQRIAEKEQGRYDIMEHRTRRGPRYQVREVERGPQGEVYTSSPASGLFGTRERADARLAELEATRRQGRTPLQPRASAGGGGREVTAFLAAAQREIDGIERGLTEIESAARRHLGVPETPVDTLQRRARRELQPRPNAGGGGRGVVAFLAAAEREIDAIDRSLDEIQQAAQRHADTIQPAAAGGGGAAPPPRPPAPPTPPTPPPPPDGPRRRLTTIGGGNVDLGSAEEAARHFQASSLSAEDAASRIDLYERSVRNAIDIDRQHAAALEQDRVEASRSATAYGAVTQEYRKHGAATTEFLSALGKGTASIEEIGYQALATAGKFAAWTAASVGVFGALAGVSEAGRGAIASMSGINELQRFINDLDTDKAQQQFRDLSREFNLPIADVTEAFANMGRVFGSQDQAFEAARSTLLAVRVGALSTADATRFLGAIYQGFKVPASGTATVIDQINQAQNRLNFSIRDGTAGIARAAGNWRAAGGTFSELLAIMATAQRTTGATGEVVGTAFRRSAEFIGRERNQAQLRGFGIDPTGGIDQIYRQAFQLVQGGQVQGQDVTRLATALSSPQLASIIGPTLQNFELYQRALRETNETASRGSGQRELAIQLDAVSERIHRVGIELGQLGANLAQAGALNALGALLETTNLMLRASNNLLETFNQLPAPIRTLTTAGLQAYGVLRLLRRLNVGESLVQRGGRLAPVGQFIQGDPARTQYRQLLVGLDREQKDLRNARERVGREYFESGRRVDLAKTVVGRIRPEDYQGPGIAPTVARQNYTLAVQAAEQNVQIARQQRAAAEVELALTNERIALGKQRNDQIRALGRTEGLRLARAANVYPIAGYVPDLNRPTETGVQPLPGREQAPVSRAGRVILPTGVRVPSAAPIVEETEAVAVDAQRQAQRETTRLARTRTVIGRTGGAIRALGAGLFFSVGGIAGLALLGLAFLPGLIDKIRDGQREAKKELDRLRDPSPSPEAYQTRLNEAERNAFARQRAGYVTPPRPPRRISDPVIDDGRRDEDDGRIRTGFEDAASAARRGRGDSRALTRPRRPNQREQAYIDILNAEQERRVDREIERRQRDDLRTPSLPPRARADRRQDRAVDVLRGSKLGELAADLENEAHVIEVFGVGRRRLSLAGRAYAIAAQKVGGKRDAKTIENFQRAQEALDSAIQSVAQDAQQEIERATTPRAQTRALTGGLRDLNAITRGPRQQRNETQRRLENWRRVQRRRQQALAALDDDIRNDPLARGLQQFNRGGGPLSAPALGGAPGNQGLIARRNRAAAALRRANARIRRLEAQASVNDKTLAAALGEAESAREGLLNAYIEGTDLIDARLRLANAKTRDPAQRAANTANSAKEKEKRISDLVKKGVITGTQGQAQIINLQADSLEAANDAIDAGKQAAEDAQQRLQDQLSKMQLRSQLRVIRLPEAQRGAGNLQGFREQLAYAQEHGADEETIGGLQLQIAQQEQDNAEEAKRRAEEAREKRRSTIESLFNLRRARTDDPNTLARLDEQEAERLLRVGGDPNERRDARSRVIEARRKRAETRREREIDDARTLNDIGRLSDEGLAKVYERAIHDRRTGVEFRRKLKNDLLRLRHDLEREDEVSLTVGDIRLPTVYDVRRFAAQGLRNNATSVINQNSVRIEVHDRSDAETVGSQLDRFFGGAVSAAGRSSGVF